MKKKKKNSINEGFNIKMRSSQIEEDKEYIDLAIKILFIAKSLPSQIWQ